MSTRLHFKTVEPPSSLDTPTLSPKSDGESESDSMSSDEGYDPPETYSDYGDWREDYADAVGISRWREL